MKWAPSTGHTVMCIVAALFVAFVLIGFATVIGVLLRYPLDVDVGIIGYMICAAFVFVFLICIPEDPDL